MKEKYFNNKKTLICFIIYILITAFIFLQATFNSKTSQGQSNIVSSSISAIVDFFTKNDLNLKENGKDEQLHPQSIEIDAIKTLTIGETVSVKAKFLPERDYPLSKFTYTSSNETIFTVSEKGVITALSQGTATLTVLDSFSKVTSEQVITVSSEQFEPSFTFGNVSGFSDEDNSVYYSTTNETSAIYAVDFTTAVSPKNLTLEYNNNEVSAVLTDNKVFFYPKRTGTITFDVIANYTTFQGQKQKHNYFNIVVEEKFIDSVSQPFTVSTQSITLPDTEVFKIETNLSEFSSSNKGALGRVFYTYDSDIITATKDGDFINVKAKNLGEKTCSVNFYSSYGGELKKQTIDITIIKGLPKQIEMVAPSKWATVSKGFYLSVMGDGKKYDSWDFDWTIVGDETIYTDGHITPKNPGKVTITATHKTIEGFTVTKEFTIKLDFSYVIRKLVGHFLLFLILALFAGVVYLRLAYVLVPNKEKLLGGAFAVTAGTLTSIISELLQIDAITIGRASSFQDVALNIVGFIIGLAIYFAGRLIIKKIQEKKAVNA